MNNVIEKVLQIESCTVGNWAENTYFIHVENEAWLIDPGDDFEKLEAAFQLNRYQIKGIINTHGHFDHIGAVKVFQEKYNLPFYLHQKDKQLVAQANLYLSFLQKTEPIAIPKIDVWLDQYTNLSLGPMPIRVHHTPGHTRGHVCFEIGNHLIAGDLFFEDKVGRTDLPGGNRTEILQSIDKVFHKFIGYQIHPGHGPSFLLTEKIIQNLRAQF